MRKNIKRLCIQRPKFVNELNYKTIILHNRAEYRLILVTNKINHIEQRAPSRKLNDFHLFNILKRITNNKNSDIKTGHAHSNLPSSTLKAIPYP